MLGPDTMVDEDTFDDLVTGITPPKLFFPAIKFEYEFILLDIYHTQMILIIHLVTFHETTSRMYAHQRGLTGNTIHAVSVEEGLCWRCLWRVDGDVSKNWLSSVFLDGLDVSIVKSKTDEYGGSEN